MPRRPGRGDRGTAPPPTDATAATARSIVPGKVHVPRVRGMARERLDLRLDDLWQHQFALVVAPAGSGKTTLLAAWAAAAVGSGIPAAWYRAESTDGDPAVFLGFLEAAVMEALAGGSAASGPPAGRAGPGRAGPGRAGPGRPGSARETLSGGWTSAEVAADDLRRLPVERLLLVIDDLHTVAGTEAERTLERLLDYAGPNLAVAAGTRALPAFDLSRRRVSGRLLELGGDDLRFRPWEVEALFRDFYGERLRGDELARLARRTEGWAAGLQLFHLATRDKPAVERARLLDGLAGGSRLVREYLTRNVLDELPEELRAFLVDTCALRRLSGPICDRYLGRSGSAGLLDALERRQVFTVALDDEGTYRYHEVLRGHLEGVLVEQRGEAAARDASAEAAVVLEGEGAIADALAAWCRAGAWAEVTRLLGAGGDRLAAGGGSWLDAVPAALVDHDPWLLLATARRLRSEGHWRQALDAYGRAEASFAGAEAAIACGRERLALAAFLDPIPRPGSGWSGHVRSALARDPLGRRGQGTSSPDGSRHEGGERLATGLAALLAGRVDEARRILHGLAQDPDADPPIAAAGGLAAAVASLLAGDEAGRAELDEAVLVAERLGLAWLARVGRAAVALDPFDDAGVAVSATLRADADGAGDPWAELLGALLEGWATLGTSERSLAAFEAAADRARRLGAGTLEAWARALGALAAAGLGLPDARATALHAEGLVRANAIPGARVPVHMALAMTDARLETEHRALAEAAALESGLRLPARWSRPSAERLAEEATSGTTTLEATAAQVAAPGSQAGPAARDARPSAAEDQGIGADGSGVAIRLFGGFGIDAGGRPLDLADLKPRPRALLRRLALDAGRPIHREVLAAAFWPEADAETAARNLHVAISSLRRVLGGEHEGGLIARDGDAYRLALPPGARVDLVDFEAALATATAARDRGESGEAVARYREALILASGELLPEDGPAEWVVDRRESARSGVTEAARSLAELLLADDPDAAARACAIGLRADPYHDPLWRLLIEARERAGDPAAASTARQGYARMLDRLGLTPEAGANGAGGVPAAMLRPGQGPGGLTAGLGTPPP